MAITKTTYVEFSVYAFDKLISNNSANVSTTITGAVEKPIFAHDSYTIKVGFLEKTDGIINDGSDDLYDGKSYKKKFRKSVIWNFGDGTKVENTWAEHVYSKAGKYTISCSMLDIDRMVYKNTYQVEVYVKEVMPTYLQVLDPKTSITVNCSEPTEIAEISATLSTNISNTPPIKITRAWDKDEDKEVSYFDLYNDADTRGYIHLRNYWAFLEAEYTKEYNTNSTIETVLKEVEEYNPEFDSIYGAFVLNDSGSIELTAYEIIPWTTYDTPEPLYIENPNFTLTSDRRLLSVNVNVVSSEDELPEGVTLLGRRAIFSIYFRSDFYNDKVKLYTSYDADKIKYTDTAVSYDDYINNPSLGFNFAVTESPECLYALTLNGIISNIDAVGSLQPIDEMLYHYMNINTAFQMYLIPYIKNDLIGYYIPKDKIYTEFSSNNDEVFEASFNSNSFYAIFTTVLKDKSTSYKFYGDGSLLLSSSSNAPLYAKDLSLTTVPKENYLEIDVDSIIESMMPHGMFNETDNLKAFLRNIFSNNDNLSYILTRNNNFFDDHSNTKTSYLNQFISTMQMMDVDISEYGYANFENVNEMRDFSRIVSMNHTDLVGHLYYDSPDISITKLGTGYNVSDKINVSDELTFNSKGRITKIYRDNTTYNISDDDGARLIIVDNNTKESKIADFYSYVRGKSSSSYTIKIEDDYDSSWDWNLLLPDVDNKNEFIEGYYSFYLLKEVTTLSRQGNFLDPDTITDNVQNVELWEKNYGIVFDCLNRLIITSTDFDSLLHASNASSDEDDSSGSSSNQGSGWENDESDNILPDMPEAEEEPEDDCNDDGTFNPNVSGDTVKGGPCLVNGNDYFLDRDDKSYITGNFSNMTSSQRMFKNCNGITKSDTLFAVDLDTTEMYANCYSLYSFSGDMKSVVDATSMFINCIKLPSFNLSLPALLYADSMFYNCSSLSEFTIDLDKVESTSGMFQNCTSLYRVSSNLANALDTSSMFYGCKSLVEFSGNLNSSKNTESMFSGCESLESFVSNIENSVNIKNMFSECTNLVTFNADMNLITNAESMFENCTKLVNFSGNLDSLTSGIDMFTNCYNLSTESINNIVKALPSYTTGTHIISFIGVNNIVAQHVSDMTDKGWYVDTDGNYLIEGDCLLDGEFSTEAPYGIVTGGPCLTNGNDLFNGREDVTSVTGTFATMSTADSMFYNCCSLTTCDADFSLLESGNSMFSGCTTMTTFNNAPIYLTSGISMFYNCSNLESIPFSFDNLVYGDSMFFNNSSLTNVITNLSSLKDSKNMFNGCSNMETISLQSLSSLCDADNMFDNCTVLTEETIEYIIDKLPDYNNDSEEHIIGFENVLQLTTDNVEEAEYKGWELIGYVEQYGGDCISGTEFSTAAPEGIVTGGPCLIYGWDGSSGLFLNNSNVTTVTDDFINLSQGGSSSIATSTTYNNFGMFNGCTNLTEVSSEFESIETARAMFYNCSSLEDISNITFGSDCTNLMYTFGGCTSIVNISSFTIPNSTKYMYATFINCTSIESLDGVDIPDSVLNMSYTFSGCTSIETLEGFTLGNSISSMDYTFEDCTSLSDLSDILLPSSLLSLNYTFTNCTSLTETGDISIPSNCTSAIYLFSGCTSLESIEGLTVESGVKTLQGIFSGCTSLYEIPSSFSLPTTITSLANAFDYCPLTSTSVDNLIDGLPYSTSNITIGLLGVALTDDQYNAFIAKNYYPAGYVTNSSICTNGSFTGYISSNGTVTGGDCIIIGYSNETGLFRENGNIVTVTGTFGALQEGGINEPDTSSTYESYGMFSECDELTTVDASFPALLSGNYMFAGCDNLNNISGITINDDCKYLNAMFKNCDSLTSIDNISLPANLKKMDAIFEECDNITSAILTPPATLTSFNNVFNDCINLETVNDITIPSSVLSMNNTYRNTKIDNVDFLTLSSGITTLENTFENCVNITDINNFTLPNSVTRLYYTFKGCENIGDLTSFSIPTNTIYLQHTFDSCASITSIDNIEIPNSTTTITGLFRSCTNLKHIGENFSIGTGVYAAEFAFDYAPLTNNSADNLLNGTPTNSSLTSMGMKDVLLAQHRYDSFIDKNWEPIEATVVTTCCSSSDTFSGDIHEGGIVYGDNCIIYGYENEIGLYENNTDVISVKGIFDNLIYGGSYSGEDNITLYGMFTSCTSLELVDAEFPLLENGTSIFKNCSSLETVNSYFPELKEAEYMFYGCSALSDISNISFSENLLTMNYTFANNSALITLPDDFIIPENVTSVQGLFYSTGLTEIPNDIIHDNINYTMYMFSNCTSLNNIPNDFNIGNNVSDASRMFAHCPITSIPSNIVTNESLDSVNGIFIGCDSLTELPSDFKLGSNLSDISYMFSGCSNLISLPDDFNIGDISYNVYNGYIASSIDIDVTQLFKDCSSLANITKITIPRNANNKAYMFSGCSSLTLDSIDEIVKGSSFITTAETLYFTDVNMSLGQITALKDKGYTLSSVYNQINDTRYESTGAVWLSSINNAGHLEAAPYLRYASEGTSSLVGSKSTLKSVEGSFDEMIYAGASKCDFSSSYTSNGTWTDDADGFQRKGLFYNCTNLVTANVSFPKTIFANCIFWKCTKLASVDNISFGNECKYMYYTFYSCSALSEITNFIIPDGVESINGLFRGCSGLTSVTGLTIGNGVTSIEGIFRECSSLTTIENLVIPGNVKSVTSLFYECTSLNSISGITFEEGITRMHASFGHTNISNLDGLIIPDSVTYFDFMFQNCDNLTSISGIHLGSGITNMSYTFSFNTALTTIDGLVLPENIENISSMFSQNTGLKTIGNFVIPPSVTSAGGLFSNCSSLTASTITEWVDSLYDRTDSPLTVGFYNVSALTSTHIANAAAKGWTLQTTF